MMSSTVINSDFVAVWLRRSRSHTPATVPEHCATNLYSVGTRAKRAQHLDRSDLSCAARGIRASSESGFRGHAINSIGVVTWPSIINFDVIGRSAANRLS